MVKEKYEPLTDECRYQVMLDASIRLNPDADILVLSDVQSAVKLLKMKIHEYHREPFDSIWDAVVNKYEQDIQKLIDDCFPVFKKEK
jgi:hypothetical protein